MAADGIQDEGLIEDDVRDGTVDISHEPTVDGVLVGL